jgi:hypothetical protein
LNGLLVISKDENEDCVDCGDVDSGEVELTLLPLKSSSSTEVSDDNESTLGARLKYFESLWKSIEQFVIISVQW